MNKLYKYKFIFVQPNINSKEDNKPQNDTFSYRGGVIGDVVGKLVITKQQRSKGKESSNGSKINF